jgi:nucleotide-binding universal stress UspA family protein
MGVTEAPPTLFDRIIVGIDGTEACYEACRQALALAPPDALIEAVTVARLADAAKVGATAPAVEEMLVREAEETLDRAAAMLGDRGRRRFLNGIATDELLREADELDAGLIVVGSHGHRRATEILIGGIAGEIVHFARRSVLVTRPGWQSRPRIICVGDDGSPEAAVAVGVARALGARLGAPLHELTAREHPVQMLVDAVTSADLLVVGSRGVHGLRSLSSVSERVAHEAPCSVLIVRARP